MKTSWFIKSAFAAVLLLTACIGSNNVSAADGGGRWEFGAGPSFNLSGHDLSVRPEGSYYSGHKPSFYPSYWGSDPGPADQAADRRYGLYEPDEAYVNAEPGSETTRLFGYDRPQPFAFLAPDTVSFVAVQEYFRLTPDCDFRKPRNPLEPGSEEDNIGIYVHLGRSWPIGKSSEAWRWGVDLGFNWRPLEGSSSAYGAYGRDFVDIDRKITTDIYRANGIFPESPYYGGPGSSLVINNIPNERQVVTSLRQSYTDYYSALAAKFDGNMFSLYPGLTLSGDLPLSAAKRTFLYAGIKAGPAIHIMGGEFTQSETLYTAVDNGAWGKYGSHTDSNSGTDVGVGGFVMGSAGLRGRFSAHGKTMWDVGAGILADFAGPKLNVRGARAETSGLMATVTAGLTF